MRLSVAVQHHPARADLVGPLLALLPEADVVVDPEPQTAVWSSWRTYRAALEATPADATHRLIVQDDAELCRNFLPAVHAVIAARPESIICLFVGGQPAGSSRRLRQAHARGEHWAPLNPQDWVPVVATVYPAGLAEELLEWPDRRHGRRNPLPEKLRRSDDFIVGLYAREKRLTVWATAPSLVQHPDRTPSLVGRRARAGANPGRVAACYIGEGDPLAVDWTV